jgi:hypothetical protein
MQADPASGSSQVEKKNSEISCFAKLGIISKRPESLAHLGFLFCYESLGLDLISAKSADPYSTY